MYDIILFGLGVYTGVTVWKAMQRKDSVRIIKQLALVAAVAAVAFVPVGFEKTEVSYALTPSEKYIITDGTSPNSWTACGVATVYKNVREFMNTGDDVPVLVYNADSYTADEAREIYKETN